MTAPDRCLDAALAAGYSRADVEDCRNRSLGCWDCPYAPEPGDFDYETDYHRNGFRDEKDYWAYRL